ncbi:MAG: hypothetical protein RIC55_10235 [Pirellulaceae bacterium]
MADDLADLQPVAPLPQDEELTQAELNQLDLMTSLRSHLDVDEYLPQMLLRRHAAGETIASGDLSPQMVHYVLTWEEVLRLKLMQLEAAETIYEQLLHRPQSERDSQQSVCLQLWIEQLTGVVSQFERKAWDQNSAEERGGAPAPVLRLEFPPAKEAPQQGGLLGKVSRLFGGKEQAETSPAPPAIEFFEADLIDPQMLSAYAPGRDRQASVVAECYVLQAPRAFYVGLCRDEGFREQRAATYRARIVEGRLRRMPNFATLEDEPMQRLVEQAAPLTADAGAVLRDENEAADAAYVVASGVVEVYRRRTALLHPQDITDWPSLCRALLAGAASPAQDQH